MRTITFRRITLEFFDDNLNGELKMDLRYDAKVEITDKVTNLSNQLRLFVKDQITKGNILFPKERKMMYALVKDSFSGEVSCLIKQDGMSDVI